MTRRASATRGRDNLGRACGARSMAGGPQGPNGRASGPEGRATSIEGER